MKFQQLAHAGILYAINQERAHTDIKERTERDGNEVEPTTLGRSSSRGESAHGGIGALARSRERVKFNRRDPNSLKLRLASFRSGKPDTRC